AAVDNLLALAPQPDAILLLADKITTETFRILREKKIEIPGEMALIGFNNSNYTALFCPSLSVIKQPAFEMGEKAARLLLQLLKTNKAASRYELECLSPDIIIRESSQK